MTSKMTSLVYLRTCSQWTVVLLYRPQATMMVFQAVAQYYTDVTDLKDINLQVDISVAGRSKPLAWTFNKGNAYLTRSLKVRHR